MSAGLGSRRTGRFVAGGSQRHVASGAGCSLPASHICRTVELSLLPVSQRSSEPAVVEALPTRTATGEWEYKPVEGVAAAAAQAMTSKDAKRQKTGVAGVVDERASGNVANHPLRQQKGAQLEELRQEVASASEKRERIAAAAAALIEAPEKNVAELKVRCCLVLCCCDHAVLSARIDLQVLIAMTSDVDTTVSRLAAVSAMLVFKDVAPGYRIRPPTDKELEMAVSKEVKAVRDYESAFLKGETVQPGPVPCVACSHSIAFCLQVIRAT